MHLCCNSDIRNKFWGKQDVAIYFHLFVHIV